VVADYAMLLTDIESVKAKQPEKEKGGPENRPAL
jgi:hypothetical protein